jgi:hypothetical protein
VTGAWPEGKRRDTFPVPCFARAALGISGGWYAICFGHRVPLDTRTKRLARTVLLLSVSSLAGIALITELNARQDTPVKNAVYSPFYTYQNPLRQPEISYPVAVSQADTGSLLSKLLSVRWVACLSSLGVLWLGASCYLHAEHSKRKRIRRKTELTRENPPKMNPLATVPARPATPVKKEDIRRIPVFSPTTMRNRFVHRQVTAPCQSRFRPTALAASQTRFGRLK